MKIVLEREDCRFATTTIPVLGAVRWMLVTVGGKQFHVRREIDRERMFWHDERAMAEIDRVLLHEMEHMLAKMFREAAAAVPEGPMDIG